MHGVIRVHPRSSAAALIRGTAFMRIPMSAAVGHSVPRKDGAEKVSGAARYVDDISFPGMLYARTIRATIPAGRVTAVRYDFDVSGFTIADWRDIPGRNTVDLISTDQPCLVHDDVRHVAEAVVLLAHEDRERLLNAHVELSYERTEPLFDPERSPIVHKALSIEKGT